VLVREARSLERHSLHQVKRGSSLVRFAVDAADHACIEDLHAGEVRLDPGTTKNGEARVFPLTAALRRVMEAQRQVADEIAHTADPVVRYVFCYTHGAKVGRCITESGFNKAWRKACAAAGCQGRIPHDCRRTAVRNLVRAGVPERVAMQLTGHKTRAVFERYNIVSPGDLRDAVQRLDTVAASAVDERVGSSAAAVRLLTVAFTQCAGHNSARGADEPRVIQPVHWNVMGGERPPFERDGRKLRVTIYSPDDAHLSAHDRSALAVLREFGHLQNLRIVEVGDGSPWRLEIDDQLNAYGSGRLRFLGPEGQCSLHAFHPQDWVRLAIRYRGQGNATEPETLSLASHIRVVEAHAQAHRDIFVTAQPDLLRLRYGIPRSNVTGVIDGLRIVGLYLRSQDDFTIAGGRFHYQFDRGLFYWILCRERLPAMWKYFSACLVRSRATHDNSEYLGNTILDRCVRVLQARDEIGFRFYQRQNNTTRDEMLYHFDYLTVMLSGVFDAQARVARLAHSITKPALVRTSFRNRGFVAALKEANAKRLVDVVSDSQFERFQVFLAALRNSVHGAGLRGLGISRNREPEGSLVRVFESATDVWECADFAGEREVAGVTGAVGVCFEPYTCATAIARYGLGFVDRIAAATDLSKLLPKERDLTGLPDAPPSDGHWSPSVRSRVDLLG